MEDGSDDIDDDDGDDLAGRLQAGKVLLYGPRYSSSGGYLRSESMTVKGERTLGRTAKEADGSGLLVVCRYVDQCSTCAARLSQWKKVYIRIYQVTKTSSDTALRFVC